MTLRCPQLDKQPPVSNLAVESREAGPEARRTLATNAVTVRGALPWPYRHENDPPQSDARARAQAPPSSRTGSVEAYPERDHIRLS